MCAITSLILNILLCVLLGAYAGISLIIMGIVARWAWNSVHEEMQKKTKPNASSGCAK